MKPQKRSYNTYVDMALSQLLPSVAYEPHIMTIKVKSYVRDHALNLMKHPLLIVYINGKNNSHRHFIQTGPSERHETGGYPLNTLREPSTQQLTESGPYCITVWSPKIRLK